MPASDLTDYYQEVYDFLASLSIKFSPLANALNQLVQDTGASVDEASPETWKYYLNLTGQYHPTDTQMLIMSLDTQQQILFSPTTLKSHPKTAAAYVPGQPLYQRLCARYPNQVDLIKSIVYPVADINLAIVADDFTILAYGTKILEVNEYDNILRKLTRFLNYIAYRWYFDFLNYEPYYTWTFWGQLWQHLLQVILLARIEAIKTTAVHSFHIWEYLKSYGLGDYSDVLSRTQTLFLYRNMPYLIANRGKQTNLVILADHLLTDLGVGLYGLDIWQSMQNGAATCTRTPELVPVGVPTKFINALPAESSETVAQIEQRLFSMGAEVDISADHLAAVTTQIATTPLNTLPTKLLELRQISTDLKFAAFLNHFLLDSLVYAIANGLYTGTISFTEPTTETEITLTLPEALILYSYCAFKALAQDPVTIPDKYTVTTAFQKTPTIPTTMGFDGYSYPMHDFTNVANYLGAYAWPTSPSASPAEFTAVLSTQFLAALNQIQISRMEEDTRANRALRLLTDAVIVRETIPLALSSATTYAAWFASQPDDLTVMFTVLAQQTDPIASYNTLANLILSNLLPATPTMSLYGNFALTNTAYAKFKELFIQLCSYDILFLDADTTVRTGVFLGKMSSYPKTRTIGRSIEFPLESPLVLKHSYTDTIAIPPVSLTVESAPQVEIPHTLSGGLEVSQIQVVGGDHRISSEPVVCVGTRTQSSSIIFDITKNKYNYLTTVS